jgi:tetratricopeptide (TPR) repeat protein
MGPEHHIGLRHPAGRNGPPPARRQAVLSRGLFFLAALGVSSAAHADVWDDCRSGPAEQVLAPCTAVIDKGDRTPDELAIAHLRLGVLYRLQGKFDQGVPDLDLAISLNPKLVNAFVNRGIIYRLKRDLDRSLANSGATDNGDTCL